MDEAKVARTESAFREVNEAIARTAERFEADEADFICECADPDCAHRITADLGDYEDVRADATRFLVAIGHDEPRVERVVERAGDYDVVEKFGGTVRRIVTRLNPRAA
jgi:hypothetical protein